MYQALAITSIKRKHQIVCAARARLHEPALSTAESAQRMAATRTEFVVLAKAA
jgi:hypothetical protein